MLFHSHGLWTVVQHTLGAQLAGYRPKEDLADTLLFIAIVVILVLMAGLMSGAPSAQRCQPWNETLSR